MQPVVGLEATIIQVREVEAGTQVGYNGRWTAKGKRRLATICVGYADGYMRALGGKGHIFVDGIAAPIVGRISMDLITIDVTGLPESVAHAGRLVELIGPNRPVDQVAAEGGTIGYEILTSLGRRYHRVYVGGE